jgi:hypothetical protein
MGDNNGGFSKDYINQLTSKLSGIASSVTGIVPGASIGTGDTGAGGVYNLLTCPVGSECYKTKHNADLLKIYNGKQAKLRRAPIDLSRAEKNYYLYNKGNTGGEQKYNEVIIDRFAKTAEQFKQNSIDMQQQFMADLSQTLKQYQSELIFQAQLTKLLKTRQAEQNVLKKNINYYQKIVQTSERKVVYENHNMNSLHTYRRILFFIYYAAVVGFIVFGNFITDKLYLKVSVWLLLVIVCIFPIILNILIMWLFVIGDTLKYWYSDPHYGYGRFQQYKDVYFDIGNPFDEAPPEAPISIAALNQLPSSLSSALSPSLMSAFGGSTP